MAPARVRGQKGRYIKGQKLKKKRKKKKRKEKINKQIKNSNIPLRILDGRHVTRVLLLAHQLVSEEDAFVMGVFSKKKKKVRHNKLDSINCYFIFFFKKRSKRTCNDANAKEAACDDVVGVGDLDAEALLGERTEPQRVGDSGLLAVGVC